MAVCPHCGETNPDRARFCLGCGRAVPQEAEASAGVRKLVTLVFCDITGSTDLGERLDPESVREIMGRYFDQMKTILERHGGMVEKFIGDAVMAVFGIPIVREIQRHARHHAVRCPSARHLYRGVWGSRAWSGQRACILLWR